MTHIITIETKNASHFEQIKKLAQQLGISAIEKHEEEKPISQEAQQFLELQKKYPPRKVSKDININAIIDEVNL
jgi:hypothetical protein